MTCRQLAQPAKPNVVNQTATPPAPVADSSADTMSNGTSAAADTLTTGSNGGNGDDYASLMARNLERYMSLQNKRSAPSRVDRRF